MGTDKGGKASLTERLFGRPAPTKGADGFTTVARLRETGLPFHRETFSGEGVLFRGVGGGLLAAAEEGELGQGPPGEDPARLERELGILFCSANPADAAGAARLREVPGDSGVALFPAAAFVAEQAAGRAGILAYAEGGMIFRYPFLTRPLPLDRITALIGGQELGSALEERLRRLTEPCRQRRSLEALRERMVSITLPRDPGSRAIEHALGEAVACLGERPAEPRPV